jgi:hypothetical protein
MLKPTYAGLTDIDVKKLKGATLFTPSSPIVETKAMGRGNTAPTSNSWASFQSNWDRSIFI